MRKRKASLVEPVGRTKWRYVRIFRTFLQQNRIFFDTLALVAFPALGVWVGLMQWQQAKKTAELTDLQAAIADAQARPAFDINIKQIMDRQTEKVENHQIQITNNGGPAYEFQSKAIYFIDVEGQTDSPPIKTFKLHIPVNDYYSFSNVIAESKGRMATIYGINNNSKFISLSRTLRDMGGARGWGTINVEEETFLRIYYRDSLGRDHLDFYRAQTVDPARLLDHQVGEEIFRKWSNNFIERKKLDSLTPEVLLNMLNAERERENRK